MEYFHTNGVQHIVKATGNASTTLDYINFIFFINSQLTKEYLDSTGVVGRHYSHLTSLVPTSSIRL